jgi:hypothetical protein
MPYANRPTFIFTENSGSFLTSLPPLEFGLEVCVSFIWFLRDYGILHISHAVGQQFICQQGFYVDFSEHGLRMACS